MLGFLAILFAFNEVVGVEHSSPLRGYLPIFLVMAVVLSFIRLIRRQPPV